MIYLNQIFFKYYENLGKCYILYYLDINQKELKSIQPLFLNPSPCLLFVGRSTKPYTIPWYGHIILYHSYHYHTIPFIPYHTIHTITIPYHSYHTIYHTMVWPYHTIPFMAYHSNYHTIHTIPQQSPYHTQRLPYHSHNIEIDNLIIRIA